MMYSSSSLKSVVYRLLVLFSVVFIALSAPMSASHAAYKNLAEAEKAGKSETIVAAYKHLKSLGFSDAAAAGVLGNANAESTFDPTLVQSGMRYTSSMRSALNEGRGCEYMREIDGIKSQGTVGVGFFQLDGTRRTAQFCWIKSQGKKWDDLGAQLTYALKNDIEQNDPFASTAYRNQFIKNYCNDEPVSCGGILDSFKDFEGFKKMTDPEKAAVTWMGIWERPSFKASTNHAGTRAIVAKEIYNKYKGTGGEAISGASTGDGAGSGGSGAGFKEVSECELEGMVCPKGFDGADVPEQKTNKDLTIEERKALANGQEYADATKRPVAQWAAKGIAFIGYLMVVWSIILAGATLVDSTNMVSEPFLLRWATLGKLEFNAEDDAQTNTRVNFKRAMIRIIIALFAGVFLASGYLGTFLLRIYSLFI